jgi:type IV secretory pathway VirB2 component (pilin)
MIQKIFFILCVYFSVILQAWAVEAQNAFGVGRITPNLRIWGDDLVFTLDNILGFIIGLFYFVSVVFAIYAGFTILTSGWDEEKVKKGKNILIYVVIGLAVVFLASQLIRFVISVMSDEDIIGSTSTLLQQFI